MAEWIDLLDPNADELRAALGRDVHDLAFETHPERFKGRRPQPPELPTAVWINPPPKPKDTAPDTQPCTLNS